MQNVTEIDGKMCKLQEPPGRDQRETTCYIPVLNKCIRVWLVQLLSQYGCRSIASLRVEFEVRRE